MDNFDWKLLYTLYETRNITRAAQKLYLSQPTITKKIQQIEEEFDTSLIVRQSRGIAFTPEGLFLVEKAQQFLNEYEELKERVHSFSREDVSGTLRIATNAPFARGELPIIIRRFLDEYPKVSFDIHSNYSRNNYQKLISGEFSLGFIREAYSWPYEKIEVSAEKIYVISNGPFHLADLQDMNEVHCRYSQRLSAQIDYWWSRHFDTPIQSSITVEDSNIAVSYVMQGLGFTILPGIVILGMEHLFYRLPLIDEKGHYLTRKTWLYYRNRSLANPVEQLFIKFMQTYAHVNAQKPDNSAFGIAPDTAYRG